MVLRKITALFSSKRKGMTCRPVNRFRVDLRHGHNFCWPFRDHPFVECKNTVMAEIHVQTKKNTGSSAWLWIVLALILIGAVAYYLLNRGKADTTVTPPANTTGAIQYFVDHLNLEKGLLQNTAMYLCAGSIQQPKVPLS